MKTFSEILRDAYLETPEQVALTLLYSHQPDRMVTYRQLFCGSASYAHALALSGISPTDVVIIILQHGEDLVYAFFGAILHGAIPSIMPFLTEKLSPGHYRQSLETLFTITSPAAIITYRDFLEEVRQAGLNTHSLKAILVCEEIQPVANPDLEGLLGLRTIPDEIVLLQHSSGTTGLQKGVTISHRAVFNQLESYARSIHFNDSSFGRDVVVSWLPLYHDMGLVAGFIMPILKRAHLVLMSPFDWVRAPQRLLHAVSRYHGTLAWLPNFAYNFCAQKIRQRDLENIDLSSWRAVINCSESMYWQSHQMFLDRFQAYGFQPESLATCYAMAENVFAVTQGGIGAPVTVDLVDQNALITKNVAQPPSKESVVMKMLSAGAPIENTSVRVLDNKGRDLPERHIGEIVIQSDCMLTGYYQRPDLTAKAFLDGWYLTGDLGYLADGEVYITGRKKDLIIVGGKNIYPQDLERLAGEVPGVHPGRVVAFGVFNPQAGTEDVVIVAEEDEGVKTYRQEVADQIRTNVTRASDIVLRYVQVVERGWLLKTSSGKIARAANRDKYLSEQ